MLKLLQQLVCSSSQPQSSILSARWDCTGSWTRESILILRTRLPILPNPKTPFWIMWRMNTMPNIDDCPSLNPKEYQATIFSAPQWLLDLVNLLSNPYDWWSDEEEYLIPENVSAMTPRRSDPAACLFSTSWLYLISPPESPMNRGKVNPNLNNYHSDPMEFRGSFLILDITDWWCQLEETRSKYAIRSNVACDMISIIPHGAGVEASVSLGWDDMGWRQSKTTGETLREIVIVRQFAWANTAILASNNTVLVLTDTENFFEMKREVEGRILHRMAQVHDFMEMWQGSQNLHAKQKESHTQNKQMPAIGYISDTDDIIKESW